MSCYDRSTPYITLQVASGVLHLKGRGHPGATTIRLADLYDVSLDSKTVERVHGASRGRVAHRTRMPPVAS